MTRYWKILLTGALAAGGLLALGYFARDVFADGIPGSHVLGYSGRLLDSSGAPVEGSKTIELKLWDRVQPSDTPVCETRNEGVAVAQGHFHVDLAACRDAISAHADLSLEVLVDGLSLGRSDISAVPYAIEADRATRADTASGALDTRLAALEARLATLESRRPLSTTDVVANVAGPLPASGELTTSGGRVLLFVAGSAYLPMNAQLRLLTVTVTITNVDAPDVVHTLTTYSNEVMSHKAFPSRVLDLPDLSAGPHTITLTASAVTVSDLNDRFNVVAVELP
ncbi:MAG: hypothetical protein ABW321_18110 [Polyangiales bacterium]